MFHCVGLYYCNVDVIPFSLSLSLCVLLISVTSHCYDHSEIVHLLELASQV
jgi:hypothetical protein